MWFGDAAAVGACVFAGLTLILMWWWRRPSVEVEAQNMERPDRNRPLAWSYRYPEGWMVAISLSLRSEHTIRMTDVHVIDRSGKRHAMDDRSSDQFGALGGGGDYHRLDPGVDDRAFLYNGPDVAVWFYEIRDSLGYWHATEGTLKRLLRHPIRFTKARRSRKKKASFVIPPLK